MICKKWLLFLIGLDYSLDMVWMVRRVFEPGSSNLVNDNREKISTATVSDGIAFRNLVAYRLKMTTDEAVYCHSFRRIS